MTPGLHVVNDVPEDQMYLWQPSDPRREPIFIRYMDSGYLVNAARLCLRRRFGWASNILVQEITRRGLDLRRISFV